MFIFIYYCCRSWTLLWDNHTYCLPLSKKNWAILFLVSKDVLVNKEEFMMLTKMKDEYKCDLLYGQVDIQKAAFSFVFVSSRTCMFHWSSVNYFLRISFLFNNNFCLRQAGFLTWSQLKSFFLLLLLRG